MLNNEHCSVYSNVINLERPTIVESDTYYEDTAI